MPTADCCQWADDNVVKKTNANLQTLFTHVHVGTYIIDIHPREYRNH